MPGEVILIVDDEPNIIQLARVYLEREGLRVEGIGSGAAALEAVDRLKPAVIILDIMLPGLDGLEVCRRLRAAGNQTPVLMLTARDEDVDRIIGLEIGADSYMTKPFNPRVLAAQVKALLRSAQRAAPPAAESAVLRAGTLTLDPSRHEVTVNGQPVELRHQEFDLLASLLEHRGMVLTREQLLVQAWGYEFAGLSRTVDVHVGHLRRRIAESGVRIETVTGVGYKLVVEQP